MDAFRFARQSTPHSLPTHSFSFLRFPRSACKKPTQHLCFFFYNLLFHNFHFFFPAPFHSISKLNETQRYGTVRGEDVPFCLGLPLTPLFPYNYTQQDIQTSRILIHYLANFIQTGYVSLFKRNFQP